MSDQEGHYDTDVIVIGAGPIGLTTGCALRHHEIDCLILEQRTEVREYSRANNIWARPQELLSSIGVRDAVAEKSYGVSTINFFVNDTPTTPTPIADVTSPYPEVLYSGQDVLERTLIDIFEERGGRIDRGCEVVDINDDGAGVTVAFTRDGGGRETLRCRYVVAADGAQSTARPLLGLDFEPEKFEDRMSRQVDAKLSWRRSLKPDQLWFFFYERGFCGVMPVWGGYHRVFFLEDDARVPDRDPTLEEMQDLAREVVGDETLVLTDPQWLSTARYQYGVSDSYARGRVLLAGDAGHIALPMGGQGMNSGFHDAVAVAWRLAMTLRGEATPLVLKSYDTERGGEHQRLNAQQVRSFKQTMYRGKLADAALGLAARVVPNIGSLMMGTDDMQQMSVTYPKSELNADHLSGITHLAQGGPKPGERAPGAEVVDKDGVTDLFKYLYNPDGKTTGWALLCFDGRSSDAQGWLHAAVAAVSPWQTVRPRLLLSGRMFGIDDVPILSDLDGKAHAAYGLSDEPSLVLVRPDGHIAFRSSAKNVEELTKYCKQVFGDGAV